MVQTPQEWHSNADEFASEILKRAIKFANTKPWSDYDAVRPDSNTLVSKHVDAQLHYLKNEAYPVPYIACSLVERKVEALETLAHAHAVDGVRVKTSQPWHADAR